MGECIYYAIAAISEYPIIVKKPKGNLGLQTSFNNIRTDVNSKVSSKYFVLLPASPQVFALNSDVSSWSFLTWEKLQRAKFLGGFW